MLSSKMVEDGEILDSDEGEESRSHRSKSDKKKLKSKKRKRIFLVKSATSCDRLHADAAETKRPATLKLTSGDLRVQRGEGGRPPIPSPNLIVISNPSTRSACPLQLPSGRGSPQVQQITAVRLHSPSRPPSERHAVAAVQPLVANKGATLSLSGANAELRCAEIDKRIVTTRKEIFPGDGLKKSEGNEMDTKDVKSALGESACLY